MYEKEILDIIESNKTENLICRNLEIRPGIIAKYISGLANVLGGYILIGAEVDNGKIYINGFQSAFNMENILVKVKNSLSDMSILSYEVMKVGFNNIYVIRVEKSDGKISVGDKYYTYIENEVEEIAKDKLFYKPTLFISYAECDTPIVELIENIINTKMNDSIYISRYTRVPYKGSFKEFMNGIQDHDYVLCVVSDNYLHSQACMYEVGEIIKDHHYKEKLLFVVLSEKERKYYKENAPCKIGPDIYGNAILKLEYINYWKKKYEELQNKIKEIDDYEATSEATKSLKEIGQIYRNDIGEFMSYLADENGKSFSMLYENEFDDIISWTMK